MADSSPLILLSGPPGAGKSTIAKLLVAGAEDPCAYIEGDVFWRFFPQAGRGSKAKDKASDFRIVIQAMVAAAVRYAQGGYETILDFSISPPAMEAISSKLKGTPLDVVFLCPSEATCAKRAAEREEGRMPDYGPYKDFYATFSDLGRFEEHAFHNEEQSAQQIADQIRKGLIAGDFRLA